MAGYSKGIVATRKLNENNKAKLGRGGDTKIRKVDGKKSHVNALEAYLIDVNGKAGEDYAKRVGAGTTNPLTGMPEYHWKADWKHMANHAKETTIGDAVDFVTQNPISLYETISGKETGIGTPGELIDDPSKKMIDTGQISENLGLTTGEDPAMWGEQKTYDEISRMSPEEHQRYLETFGLEGGDLKYFQDIFTDKPFGFLGKQEDLTTRGLESAYGATMGALGSQQAALGMTTGRGISQATQSAGQATRKSNMAFSGTVTQGLEEQKKQLFQDYTAGMGDIGRQRGTALETLTLGKEGAALDLSKGTYTEEQRQLDEYWNMIAMRQQVG